MIRARSVALAALLAVPFSARADEEPAKVRATTFLLEHRGIDDALLVSGMRQLDDALRRNARLEMKDLDTRLADFAQEIPSEQIEEGRKAFTEGAHALAEHDLPTAQRQLRAAVETLSKVLPFIKKNELAEAMLAFGVALCEAGDKKGCRAQFQRLLVWRIEQKYDPSKYPDKHVGIFEEVRKETEKAKRGSLEIRSDPPSAQAYVDGKYVGVTPAFAEGLIVGEHFITLKREGYHKAVQPTTVSAKVQGLIEMKLERSAKFLLVEEALRAVEREVGRERLDPDVDNLKEVLFLDHAVFIRAQRTTPGKIRIAAHLYDLRSRRRLVTQTREVLDGEAEKLLAGQGTALYTNVRYDADLETPADEPLPQLRRAPQPVYKRWWFWTIIGVVAVGVGATTGILVEKYKPVSCDFGSRFCVGPAF